MKRTIISAVCVALAATACGTDDADDTTDAPGTTAGPGTTSATTGFPGRDPGEPVLMIEDEGGFAPIDMVLNRPPTFVLLGDGTLISVGPQVGAFPGPVMPAMQQVQLNEDQVEDVKVLIEATGLPEIDEVINDDAAAVVADATTTVATYFDADGGTHRISVYALGIDPDPSDQLANLLLLRTKLSDFALPGGEPYHNDRVIVRVLEGGGIADFDDTRPWAFSFEPSDMPAQAGEVPCRVLESSAADEVKQIMADATQATVWEHTTGTFTVLARELTPGEAGCPAQ